MPPPPRAIVGSRVVEVVKLLDAAVVAVVVAAGAVVAVEKGSLLARRVPMRRPKEPRFAPTPPRASWLPLRMTST